ncbi:MAG: hypothetical protein RMK45_02740 [Armatimonadota bacterium]|nr:hypothetical protein [Armatimonadota bacterium]
MAKPIPVNRRWLRNQQRRQASGAPAAPVAPAPRSNSLADLLREVLAEMRAQIPAAVPAPAEVIPDADSLAHDDRVLVARYRQACSGCGGQIVPGMLITRHPTWGEWVHLECVHRQQRAAYRTLAARYHGVCRVCRRPIHPGQTITMRPLRGWVHVECADMPLSGSGQG